MRVNSKSNPMTQISTAVDTAIVEVTMFTKTHQLKNKVILSDEILSYL